MSLCTMAPLPSNNKECGKPATEPYVGMCVHEHVRRTTLCARCKDLAVKGVWNSCRECVNHPTHPHDCDLTDITPMHLATTQVLTKEV